jgi:hypothetical protein
MRDRMIKESFDAMGVYISANALRTISRESSGCIETALDLYMTDSAKYEAMNANECVKNYVIETSEDELEITAHVKHGPLTIGLKKALRFPLKIGEFVLVVQSTIRDQYIDLDGKSISLYTPDPVKINKKVKSSFHGQRVSQGIVRVKAEMKFGGEARDIAKLDPVTAKFIEKLMEMGIVRL